MIKMNHFVISSGRNLISIKYLTGIFITFFMVSVAKPDTAYAGLQKTYVKEQTPVYTQTSRRICGQTKSAGPADDKWADDNRQTRNALPDIRQTADGWLRMDERSFDSLPDTGQTADGWLRMDGQTYYFEPDTGRMITGWLQTDGHTYYFEPDTGCMVTGWLRTGGKTYYFQPDTGRMVTGWLQYGKQRYYLQPDTGQMATGWFRTDGQTCYFQPDTGCMAAGWQKIEGDTYYFQPDTGYMAAGWLQIDGQKYYFKPGTGQMASGLQKLKNNTYYFSPETGEMLTGWQKTATGRRYFFKETGRMATGWQKINGKKYYFAKDDGRLMTGSVKIHGEYYVFNDLGQLAQSEKTSIVHAGNQIYCADKSGKAVSGWQIIGNNLYYTSKTGRARKNTTYQGITFGNDGAARNNINTSLKIHVLKILDSITDIHMTKDQKLDACWKYLTGSSFRYAAKYPDLNVSGWQRKAACDMLSSHAGNCYGFACAFAALAEAAGFQPYVICGRVQGSRDRMSDGYTRHAWVRINGRYYDPEAHYAGWRQGIYNSAAYPVPHTIQKILAF